MPSQGRKQAQRLAFLVVLLALGVHRTHARVIVLEQGSGEAHIAGSFFGSSYVFVDEENQAFVAVQSGQRSHGEGYRVAVMATLWQPLTWVYRQLEAIEALQRASINTYLLRAYYNAQAEPYYQAELEDSAAAAATEQEDGMSDRLHRLGCQRFSVAMDEYLQAAEAAAFSSAYGIQEAMEMVEDSESYMQAQLDGSLDLLEEEEQEQEVEQLLEYAMLEHELQRLAQEPGAEAQATVWAQHQLSQDMPGDGSRPFTAGADMDAEDWDSTSELLAQGSYQGTTERLAENRQHEHLHQLGHWHDQHRHRRQRQQGRAAAVQGQGLQRVDHHAALRGDSHWSSVLPMEETGNGASKSHAQRVTAEHGLWGNPQHAAAVPRPRLHDDIDSDDAFQPYVDLLEQYQVQRRQKQAAAIAATAAAAALPLASSQSAQAGDSANAVDFDSDALQVLLPMLPWDWLLLAMLSLVLAAASMTSLVSWRRWLQLSRRRVSLPVTISHKGRLVKAMVLLPEEDAKGVAEGFVLSGAALSACFDGHGEAPMQQGKKQ